MKFMDRLSKAYKSQNIVGNLEEITQILEQDRKPVVSEMSRLCEIIHKWFGTKNTMDLDLIQRYADEVLEEIQDDEKTGKDLMTDAANFPEITWRIPPKIAKDVSVDGMILYLYEEEGKKAQRSFNEYVKQLKEGGLFVLFMKVTQFPDITRLLYKEVECDVLRYALITGFTLPLILVKGRKQSLDIEGTNMNLLFKM